MDEIKEKLTSTTININPTLWNSFKLHCVKQKVSMSERLSELIKKEIADDGTT